MLRAANQSQIAPRRTRLLGLWSRWSRVRAPSLTPFALLVTMFVGLVKRVGVLRRVQIAVASGRYTYGVEPNLDLVRLRELVDVDPAVACLVLSTRRL